MSTSFTGDIQSDKYLANASVSQVFTTGQSVALPSRRLFVTLNATQPRYTISNSDSGAVFNVEANTLDGIELVLPLVPVDGDHFTILITGITTNSFVQITSTSEIDTIDMFLTYFAATNGGAYDCLHLTITSIAIANLATNGQPTYAGKMEIYGINGRWKLIGTIIIS